MKAQLLLIVLLFSVTSSYTIAQERSQSNKKDLMEHPALKYFNQFENSLTDPITVRSKINTHQLTAVELQVWRDTEWESYFKYEHMYELGKRVETTGYYIPEPGGGWVASGKQLYTYVDDMLTRVVIQGINPDGTLASEERTLITTEQSGGVTLIISTEQSRNEGMQNWTNVVRTILRSENGMINGGSYYEWIENAWEEVERFTLEELNGDIIETTTMYDPFLEEWVNYTQIVYSGLTVSELYDMTVEFISQVDNGTLIQLLTMLPNYTAYEWMDDGETASWIMTDRQISEPSSELEFGATSATLTSLEFYDVEFEQWFTAYSFIVGENDESMRTGVSFYSISNDLESVELEKVFSEEYQYDSNDLLVSVLKYGSWDDFTFFKQQSNMHPTGRSVLTWGDVNTTTDPLEGVFSYKLNPAYPNPFNPGTVIPFELADASAVNIQVYDMLGRHVVTLVDEVMIAGNHSVLFDGSGLSSGMYLVRMSMPGSGDIQTRSITLIK